MHLHLGELNPLHQNCSSTCVNPCKKLVECLHSARGQGQPIGQAHHSPAFADLTSQKQSGAHSLEDAGSVSNAIAWDFGTATCQPMLNTF